MKKMRKYLAFLMVLCMIFALFAGCASSDDGGGDDANTNSPSGDVTDAKGYTIALLAPNMGIDYYRQVAYGIMEACELYGCEMVIKTGITSLDLQLQAVEDLIEAGVDAIIMSPMDSYGAATALDLCENAGVALISQAAIYGANTDPVSVMETDNVWMGEIVAEYVIETVGENANVVILKNEPGVANSEEKVEGMQNIFDQYSGIEVLEIVESASQLEQAQTKSADLCQRFGMDIDVVIGINELACLGAINSFIEYGYTVGEDVLFFSCNYATELDTYIQDGTVLTGIYSWGNLFGFWGVQMAIRYLDGTTTAEHIWLPATLVTADNLDTFSAASTVAKDFDFDAYVQE